MPVLSSDYYGHQTPCSPGVSAAYTGVVTGTSAPGTIVAGGTVVTAAPAAINANDVGGNFTVTVAAASAGVLASVFFAQPYPALVKAVSVSAYDVTGATALLAVWSAVAAGSQAGFIITAAAPTTIGHVIFVSYDVQA